MKNSVNSLTFEEIFAQRGKEVSEDDVKLGFYFLKDRDGEFDAIVSVFGIKNSVYANCCLWFDGEFCIISNELFCPAGESMYFEATPDQIALLNSYK